MRPLLALVLLTLLGGCATKRDVRDLRMEVSALRAAQDSAFREMRRDNERLFETLTTEQVRTRGDLANRLLGVERQLVQVQELTGQGQQRLLDMREELNARARSLDAQAATGGGEAGAVQPSDPDELYAAALASFRRGSMVTARAGFEEFLRANPTHRLAADAHFYIGESHGEGNPEQALAAFARVVQDFSTSPRAPTALYRSGLLEAARGNRSAARAFFNRVVQSYAQSPEARQARAELQRLR